MQRYQVITQAELERIHENSLRIMENIGIYMPDEYTKDVLRRHGAKVDGDMVHFPPSMVEKAIRFAPSSYTIYGRDSTKDVEISCERTAFAGPYGCSFVNDLDRGRRDGSLADFIDIVKICDKLDNIDIMSHIP